MMEVSMKKAVSAVFVAFLFLGLAGPVFAASISERIAAQQMRIDRGVRRGDLTNREARILQANLDHIRDRFQQARADGTLRRERRRIEKMLDHNSRMIHKRRHNAIRSIFI
jgi:hypothetical protein